MPDKQITDLSSGGALGNTDLLLTRQDGSTEDKKITASQIRSYIETAFNIDNLTNGSTNVFMQIGASVNSLTSHDATGAYLEGDIAIGYNATAGENGGVATDHKNTAIGYNALASGRYSLAMGQEARATGTNSVSTDFIISPDKSTLVFVAPNETIYQFTMSTPGDLSTASYDNVSYDASGFGSSNSGLTISNDGSKMFYMINNSPEHIYEIDL